MGRRLFSSLSVLLLCVAGYTQNLEEDLRRIDAAIEMTEDFRASHELRVGAIENRLAAKDISPKEAYLLYANLFKVQFSYKFDLAKAAVDKEAEIAERLQDRQMISEAAVDRALLYCVAGMYLESQEAAKQIDTTLLSPSKRLDYYNYKQRFHYDFHDNASGAEVPSMRDLVRYYRNRILAESSPDDYLFRLMGVREALDEGNFPEADSLGSHYLSTMDPYTHDFAELSYYKAVCCRNLGNSGEMMHWFAMSAIADIRSNTKDNASLQSLAIELLNRNEEIERAFRYTQYSLDDAVFFNAKLRPWQIAMSLPPIEKAYMESRQAQERRDRILMGTILALVVLMLVISLSVISQYLKLKKSQREMEEMNLKIKLTLKDLSLANAAKEEYLGLFLSMCSKYIDKLKKFMTLPQIDAELASFYRTFDDAFLQLYPDFVEKFNALLLPEARMELKKDESLNTPLRVFALIKLGITQSSHIATLLRYSVNTIYNYRAQIKNAALDGKESFEDRIRQI